MHRHIWWVFVAGALFAPSSWAASQAPYAGWDGREIKALSAEQIDELRTGRGMGLALSAELNGYPGPRHVLDFADALDLSAEQRVRTQELFDAMQAQAIALGQQVIAGEAALDRMFADSSASEDAVQAATAELGQLQGTLRGHHLRYHLATRELLSPHQVMRYQELRGYAADGGPDHGAGGHGGHTQ
jgi:Spy/CpxP family protein refolding chaperone